ncbi:hypothetical protein BDN70DRAFT_874463 [Pholiota conissans]|uniref:Uncharacterized protein n=1 Tax=Pholiota conissans TaxID=109636 RepID=A0A9P6D4Q9_9AGAR|nr:hypothetical protein BDN70DRAFT_874463 [Pholiota conissans]
MSEKRGPLSNNFGYSRERSAMSQLMQLLHMEEESSKVVSTIKHFTQTGLDMDKAGSRQMEQVASVMDKIKEKYPHIFGDGIQEHEKRMYYAYQYILYVHSLERHKRAKKEKGKKNSKVKGEVNFKPRSSESLVPEEIRGQAPKKNKENLPPSSSASRIATMNTQLSQSSSIDVASFSQSSASTADSFDTPFRTSSTLSSSQKPSMASDHIPKANALSNSYVAPVHPVYVFLDTCLPSMAHHFQSVIDFGCSTEEFLFSMSAWEPMKIRHDFLDRLPPNRYSGERLTEMEKLVLQNHISTYFRT